MKEMSVSNVPVPSYPRIPRAETAELAFLNYAKAAHPVSQAAEAFARQKIYPLHVQKGAILVKAGQVCPAIYYVKRGILRGYVQEGIKDITTWITCERELATAISSFDLQRPSVENIQALEDADLAGLNFEDLQYMYDHFPEINIVGRKILQQYYRDAEERAFIARLTEATSKYKRFAATKNDMLSRVPLKYIASYLGMTMETLSRIRSKLSRGPNGIHY
jgi:CRP-like cAMP-binding protein